MALAPLENMTNLPKHVAIIMDGNGRWAKQRHLPRLAGHRAGAKTVRSIIEHLTQYHIPYLTLYSFSTENWQRPRNEVSGIFNLAQNLIDNDFYELRRRQAHLRHLGQLDGLPVKLQNSIKQAVEQTKSNTGITIGFAFNYGGRSEILDAVRQIISDGVPPDKIDEKLFQSYLYTTGFPNVDLLIRTGGELRISNFLLWQSAYAEFYFSNVLWPDFSPQEIDNALIAYQERERRFGGLK